MVTPLKRVTMKAKRLTKRLYNLCRGKWEEKVQGIEGENTRACAEFLFSCPYCEIYYHSRDEERHHCRGCPLAKGFTSTIDSGACRDPHHPYMQNNYQAVLDLIIATNPFKKKDNENTKGN